MNTTQFLAQSMVALAREARCYAAAEEVGCEIVQDSFINPSPALQTRIKTILVGGEDDLPLPGKL